jgi:hypothetical protein
MKKIVFLACFGVMCGAGAAQTPCDALSKEFELNVKEIAFADVDGIFDDSAPRATIRKMEKVFQASALQSNLLLMQANKCPPPKAPVNAMAYRESAILCAIASSKAQRAGDKGEILECDRDKWARSAK